MTTFLTVQTNIAADLDDPTYGRFAQAKVKRLINEGRKDILSRAKLLKKESAALIAASTTPTYAFYALPDDFLMLDESKQGGVWSDGRRLWPIDQGCLGNNWATVTGSPPSNYIKPTGGKPTALRLWPYSTTALLAVTAWYAYLPADLSEDADLTQLPPEFDVALEFYAKSRLLRGGEDAEQRLAVAYAQDYEAKVMEAISKAAGGSSNQPAYIRYNNV